MGTEVSLHLSKIRLMEFFDLKGDLRQFCEWRDFLVTSNR